MEKAFIIIFVGLLVFLSHAFVALFEKTKVPDVLYLILIGLIIGPILGIVDQSDFGKVGPVFSTIALVVILFEGGMEISFDMLKNSFKLTVVLSLFTYLVSFTLLSLVLYFLFGISLQISLYIGAVLAGPAPAVVIPLVKQLKMREQIKAALILESGLAEALCIIISLSIFQSIIQTNIQIGKLVGSLLSSILFAVFIGGIGGYIWSLILNKIRNLQNAIFTTPSFIFILYGLCEVLGFSGPVAALTFGITIGNIKFIKIPYLTEKLKLNPIHHNETEKLFFSEIVFLIKTFFFVYLGISIIFSEIWIVGAAALLVLILLISRVIGVRFSINKSICNTEEYSRMSVLISKGLATTVLASVPLLYGLPEGEFIRNIVYSVILLSIIVTSLLVFLSKNKTVIKFFSVFFNNSDNNVTVKPGTE
jgi:potassium/hydrogen antiporter